MKTKQLLSLALLGLLTGFMGCQKEPSIGSLDDEYLVYTACDKEADFAAIETFYLPDSILLIGEGVTDSSGNTVAKYWADDKAKELVSVVADKLAERGYERILDGALRAEADAGVQLSYVEQTTYFTGYNNPYWWNYYPYYWSPGYWGSWWGGWYHPYQVYYGYTTGSLLTEMVDLSVDNERDAKLTVIWNSYVSGLLNSSMGLDMNDAEAGIVQAFEQSPYLKNN